MQNNLLDLLSNENLENLLNGLNWVWSEDGGKKYGIETISLKEIHDKSYLATFLVAQLISMNHNLKIGDYYYRMLGHSISRTGPKIRKPDQNKTTYAIRRILS